ncbi:MAG: TolC family protein [Cytophagales bacterium]|nr:TolC family protein [Cytophagales bacterium]
MRIFKTICFILVIFPLALVNAQEIKKWSLEDCVNHAFENNLDVQRSVLSMQNQEVTLLENKLNRLPNLNMNIFNSWRWGRSIDPTSNLFTTQRINSNGASASSQMLLYNGSRLSRTIKRNEKDVQASYYDMEKSKNDVALNVVLAYLQVIFTRELLENSNYQYNTTGAQMEQTEKLVNAGSLPRTNLLDLQSQLASNEVEVINSENDVNLALLRLKQFLQIPAEEEFDIITPVFDKDDYGFVEYKVGEVYKQAESIQPEIKSAKLKIESADLGIKVARGAHIPQLAISGDFFTNYSDQNRRFTGVDLVPGDPSPIGYLQSDPSEIVVQPQYKSNYDDIDIPTQWQDNRSWSAGFNISVPIFNGWQTRSNIQRAKIEKNLAEINATQTRNILRETIETAYNDAQAAIKVFDAAKKQVEALEESFRATEKSYNLGAVNYVDYQISSFNLFSARSNLVRAKFDYIFKLKVLDFYLGNPITL